MDERLILSCKFLETSFFVFLAVDLVNQEFVVIKTVPEMNVNDQRYPFDIFAGGNLSDRPTTDQISGVVIGQLERYINNTH